MLSVSCLACKELACSRVCGNLYDFTPAWFLVAFQLSEPNQCMMVVMAGLASWHAVENCLI